MPSVSTGYSSRHARPRTRTGAGSAAEPWFAGVRRLYAGREGVRFALFAALLVLVALCGGSSRSDAGRLLLLRPGVVLLATAMLAVPGPRDRSVSRAPLLLLAALAATMLLQLVPLPPGLWMRLPGHAFLAEAAAAAGVDQPWRPVTLSVDLTLSSLAALGVPAAVLLGGGALRADQRVAVAGMAVAVAVVSALLGLAQLSLGPPAYPYAPTSYGRPVGLFANINHQAAFLAAMIPVAIGWAATGRSRGTGRWLAAGAAIVLLLATILVTGSRGGFLLALLAVLSLPLVTGVRAIPKARRRLTLTAGAVSIAVLLAVTWAVGRLGGLDRLLVGGTDQRLGFLPITLGLLRDYAPFGSGFGTFDAVFRHMEPDAVLKLTYFNHAHNDLLELGITGGLAALAVALCYLAWLARRGAALFRDGRGAGQGTSGSPLARAGLLCSVVLLVASLADYPLRAPFTAATLALATLLAGEARPPRDPAEDCA